MDKGLGRLVVRQGKAVGVFTPFRDNEITLGFGKL